MLKKADVPAPPPLKEETVNVPELKGEVIVRGLLLKDRIDLSLTKGFGRMAGMLAPCVLVLDAEGEKVPLFTAEEWERWGSANYVSAMQLWDKARILSDIDGEQAAKNSPAQKAESPAASL